MFKLIFKNIIISFVVLLGACSPVNKKHQNEPELSSPPNSDAGVWLLQNHKDKIAHYDEERNIFQIKVLNQIRIGAAQCGYHRIRHILYLNALGRAIEKRDESLVNVLFIEIHDEEKYKTFVDALAELKGCSKDRYYGMFPNEKDWQALIKKAPLSLPSSFVLEDILKLASDCIYYWSAKHLEPVEESETILPMIDDFARGFHVELSLSPMVRRMISMGGLVLSKQISRLDAYEHTPMDIALYGQPGHAVAADIFKDRDSQRLVLLFADSWADESFLTGWSKGAVDHLYFQLIHPKETAEANILVNFYSHFISGLRSYHGISSSSTKLRLHEFLAILNNDPATKSTVRDIFKARFEAFEKISKENGWHHLSLHKRIMELIEKLGLALG